MITKLLNIISLLGVKSSDPDEVKQEKRIIVWAAIASSLAALTWGSIYVSQGEIVGGAILIFGGVGFFLYLPIFTRTGNLSQLKLITFLDWLIIPPSSMWFLGGFYPSSILIAWSFIAVLLALMNSPLKYASRWFYAYFLLLIASGFIQPFLPDDTLLPDSFITVFLVLNLGTVSIIIYMMLRYFIIQRNMAYASLEVEQEKSNNLLLNVLPKEIAEILKENDQTIADHFEEASVIFADLVGFTPMTERMTPEEMIGLLNDIYSHFDKLVDNYGLEKIRTIGDNYMAVSGVPKPRKDHAQAIASLAIEMQLFAKQIPARYGYPIEFRIGVNSGSLIAGVIGKKKFHYDVWGDTVNTASRMESHGVAGKIQVTENTYRILKDEFIFEPRGIIDVKGKGRMETWFLVGKNHE